MKWLNPSFDIEYDLAMMMADLVCPLGWLKLVRLKMFMKQPRSSADLPPTFTETDIDSEIHQQEPLTCCMAA